MEQPTTIIAGVDTHTGIHTLALLDMNGRVLSTNTFGADPDGYGHLIAMLGDPARCAGIGVEGTNSFGAALARRLQAAGFPVYEVLRPKRGVRRKDGKSDPIDAIAAARSVLAGDGTSLPKSSDGWVEALRHLNAERSQPVTAMTTPANSTGGLPAAAPEPIREKYRGLRTETRMNRLASCRPSGGLVAHSVLTALKGAAKAWRALKEQADPSRNACGASSTPTRVPCSTSTAPAPSPRPRSPSSPGTTPNASATRPRSPNSAARVPSPRPAARPTVTGSTGAATGRATWHCTASPSSGSDTTSRPATTWRRKHERGKASSRSSAVSNAISPARRTRPSSPSATAARDGRRRRNAARSYDACARATGSRNSRSARRWPCPPAGSVKSNAEPATCPNSSNAPPNGSTPSPPRRHDTPNRLTMNRSIKKHRNVLKTHYFDLKSNYFALQIAIKKKINEKSENVNYISIDTFNIKLLLIYAI